MHALEKWTALDGVSGNKVYLQLTDVVLFEEMDISGKPATLVINRYGVKVTVLHSAEEIARLLELDSQALLELNLKYWKDREEWRREMAELKNQVKERVADAGVES